MSNNASENPGSRNTSDESVEGRLRFIEKKIDKMEGAVYGDAEQDTPGLIKRVKEIETGDIKKIKRYNWWIILFVAIGVILAAAELYYNAMDK